MNCCDEYGNCRQGRDCPVRVARAKSAQPIKSQLVFHAKALGKWLLLALLAWLIYIPLIYFAFRA